ncbi:hypothetical protein SBF1_590003 [Candidatus Desulfosporosinus infrequens]|uniref:Uncharacterized protein n=1 Tax=Candidatus Desulfosporosinus infrequens TaxID=2043169 RepID=A0A2U3LL84_9FIRM|nr:hypothetical protein SBF1_590003 [Candidatus Desulfosporosinus infrequens]
MRLNGRNEGNGRRYGWQYESDVKAGPKDARGYGESAGRTSN